MVAGADLRITCHQDTFSVTDHSSDGGAFGKSQVFNQVFGYFGPFRYGEFCNVRIGKSQAFHIRHVGVQHHLVDMAGSNHFFIDNCADVKTLCHTNIVDVLHFCHRLFHSHTFGGETGKDIRFRVAGQGYKCFGIL